MDGNIGSYIHPITSNTTKQQQHPPHPPFFRPIKRPCIGWRRIIMIPRRRTRMFGTCDPQHYSHRPWNAQFIRVISFICKSFVECFCFWILVLYAISTSSALLLSSSSHSFFLPLSYVLQLYHIIPTQPGYVVACYN